MSMATCKFCLAEGVKLVNSHIIPKAFYFQDGKGVNSEILSENGRSQRSPQGIYDQIVCDDCEKSFGAWDDYAFKLLKKDCPDHIAKHPENGLTLAYEYSDVDYPKLKLFFLSVMWRAHASSKGFFDRFQLPEELAQRLLTVLKSRVAPEAEDWAVFVGKSAHPISLVVAEPSLEKIDGALFAKIYLPCYVVYIKLDDSPIPKRLMLHLLYPGVGLTAFFYDFVANGELERAREMVAIQAKISEI